VAEPQSGAPAAKAGIESGDVIVSINGKEARDSREVARTISNLPPGTTAAIGVIRKGQERTFNIVLGNLPDQREANANPEPPKQKGTSIPRLGMLVAPSADGAIVTNVDPDGVAAEQGFVAGDIILQAAGKKIASAADLRSAIDAAQKAGKHTVVMRVKSADGIKFVALPVGRG
jgi:serine protease Do